MYAINEPCLPVPHVGNFCVTKQRLHDLATFVNDAGWSISFGLNAMYGRNQSSDRFNSSQVEALFGYVASQPDLTKAFAAFQFGNELEHKVDAAPYAADLVLVRSLLNRYFPDASTRPLLVAPDENPDAGYITEVFSQVPHGTADAVTWHQYTGYGLDPKLQQEMMTSSFYDSIKVNSEAVSAAANTSTPGSEMWIGESALAWHSGQNGTTNAFYSSLWYTIQLGQLAWTHTVQCRQTFMGGYYELVDKFRKTPNPDAWLALLFNEVMGVDVVAVDVSSSSGTGHTQPDPHYNDVYAFVHCLPSTSGRLRRAAGTRLPSTTAVCSQGVGLAAVNLGTTNTTYSISLSQAPSFPGAGTPVPIVPRNEFHFAPVSGQPLSTRRVAVNGNELIYQAGAPSVDKPAPARITNPGTPLQLDPRTVLFVQFE